MHSIQSTIGISVEITLIRFKSSFLQYKIIMLFISSKKFFTFIDPKVQVKKSVSKIIMKWFQTNFFLSYRKYIFSRHKKLLDQNHTWLI